MRDCKEYIKVRTTREVSRKNLTLGEDLPVSQLVYMIETICSFYSGYPDVTDEYKESCPDCPLNLWFCDKLSTLTDDFLREVLVEYGKIITLKHKYNVRNFTESKKLEKVICGKK